MPRRARIPKQAAVGRPASHAPSRFPLERGLPRAAARMRLPADIAARKKPGVQARIACPLCMSD